MLDYAFLFPVGLLIATLAMSSGVAGSNFWIPVYLLGLGLEPRVAFWTSLLTMIFGFGSGTVRNLRAGSFDVELLRRYAKVLLPATVAGALLSPRLPVEPLLLTYSACVITYGAFLTWASWGPASRREGPPRPRTDIAWGRALVAGGLQGAIATGAGSLLMPSLLGHRLRRPADAVGTTVILVFAASLISAVVRVDAALWRALVSHADQIAAMMLFAVPGVILGGQLGPRLAAHLPSLWLRRYVAVILLVIGTLVARRALA